MSSAFLVVVALVPPLAFLASGCDRDLPHPAIEPEGPRVDAAVVDASHTGPTVDRSLVIAAVARNTTRIQGCYTAELRTQPTLAGRMTIHFTISEDGRATQVFTSGFDATPTLAACVANVVRAIPFPKTRGGAIEFVLPFDFSPT